jgi:hypothetical protein
MNKVWSYTRGSVSARVTVTGTYNQPVHVALRTARVDSADLDCRAADYTSAAPGPGGTAVAADSNLATVTVQSAPLARSGCYEPVPVLTMDRNRTITAAGSFDALAAAVAVGPDPTVDQNTGPATTRLPDGGAARPLVAAVAFLLLCLIALTFALHTARRMASEQPATDALLLD